MKSLSYNDIRKREINLNSHSNKTTLNIPYLFEKLGEQYSFNNAKIIIENWKNLSDNEIESFDKALETFLIVCENDNECNIKALSNIMETKLIQKARDAKATRHLNNYKLGKFKIYNTKINNKIKASKDNVKNAIANKGKVVNIYHPNRKYDYDIYGKRRGLNNKSVSKKDDDSKNKTVNECFDSFISLSSKNDKCDRILENNRILMSKFNLDNKVRSCKLYKDSIIDCIYELCQFIDTYDTSDIIKYNIALENIYYTMHKNCINIPDENIIESVTDYFLFTRNDIDDKYIDSMKYSLDNIELYTEQDLEIVDYLYGNDIISENKTFNNSCDYLDNLLLESKNKDKKEKNNIKTKEDISKFKMAKEKTIEGLKTLITRFFCNSKENIVRELPDIFVIIRNGLVLGTFAINPLIGIISMITNQILRLEISRSEATKILKEYDKEIAYYQKKADDASGDDYDKYSKMVTKLEKDKDKYAEYEKTLYSEKQIEKRYQSTNEDTDIYNLYLIQNMAPLIESMDWDIKGTMENIKENVYYFDPETIYVLTETVLLCPNVFDIDVYKNILEDCRYYHRRCNNLMTKYMIIDSLNVCLRKLNECNKNKINETYDLEKSYLYNTYFQEVMNDTIELVNSFTPINEFSIDNKNKDNKKKDTSSDIRIDNKDINVHSKHTITVGNKFKNKNIDNKKPDLKITNKKNDKPPIQNVQDTIKKSGISITSKLKLAQTQLKRTTESLKDKEKALSEKIDVDMSQTHKSIEKALTNNNREAVIKGSLIPSASRCIKAAVITGAAWAVNPAIAVIGAVGAFAMSKKLQKKERQLILDDIDIELQMCDKYLRIAEDKNDMKATRNILQTKRALQRQQQRLRYDMSVHFETPPKVKNTNGDDSVDESYVMLPDMEVL